MTDYPVKYNDASDRKRVIAEKESQGLALLHDSYDPGWTFGQELRGTLVFTDSDPRRASLDVRRDPLVEIDKLKASLVAFDTRLKKDIAGHIR